jgi:hypothetical protein
MCGRSQNAFGRGRCFLAALRINHLESTAIHEQKMLARRIDKREGS